MKKLNCIICDLCRIVCTNKHYTKKSKKGRDLHFCPSCRIKNKNITGGSKLVER